MQNAEGQLCKAHHDWSHAEGYGTISSGSAAHAEGGSSVASGNYSHAEGTQTTASGYGSHVGGDHCLSNASSSFSHGTYCTASHDNSAVLGGTNISSVATNTLHSQQGDFKEMMTLQPIADSTKLTPRSGSIIYSGSKHYGWDGATWNAFY